MEDCAFGYRDSYFKRAGKGKYFITRVYLTLQKQPVVNVSYGAIKEPEIKRHPCLVPFDHLPIEQRAKDYIFRAIVLASL